MHRIFRKVVVSRLSLASKRTFLSNEYKCVEPWKEQTSSSILNKVNLDDFYNILEQNFTSKGVISAIDVDVFANAVNDAAYLEELKDLLHKLRLSAETGITLDSTHHATIRKFIEYDHIQELVDILKQPLDFGLFMDDYTANILLDKLITVENYDLAADVASLVMLQESYINNITCALCQYAAYKYVAQYVPPPRETTEPQGKNKKVEEIKIRVKFLRNPYFDDHFDITDKLVLSGKTLAWISEGRSDNLNINLQIIGWLFYQKYDKLTKLCELFAKSQSSKVYSEVKELLKKRCSIDEKSKDILENCITILDKVAPAEVSLEESLKNAVENAINKSQKNDILQQKQLFKTWSELREIKLEEQAKRLDRAKRMQLMQEKQKKLAEEEQKLWFFDNEAQIDLQIEEKEQLVEKSTSKKGVVKKTDENYIPPEIVPKRR